MSRSPPITLTAHALELSLSPSIGGSISRFDWVGGGGRVPILRKCNSCTENVLEAASFPLVPYVNRIRGGKFAFRGRDITLAPNMAGDPSPLHGQGWLSPWRVDDASASEARLSFHHQPGEWPWAYRAEQHFALDDGGLSLNVSCRNLSSEPNCVCAATTCSAANCRSLFSATRRPKRPSAKPATPPPIRTHGRKNSPGSSKSSAWSATRRARASCASSPDPGGIIREPDTPRSG